MPPLVSIILTSYNQKDYLQKAFDSLLAQTYKNIEIIIVDDCSTDRVSKKYVESLGEKYPNLVMHYFQKKNVGVSANKNSGIKLATGDYITYLDGDDFYHSEKIEKEVEFLEMFPGIDVVYSNFNYCSRDGLVMGIWKEDNDTVHEGNIFRHVVSRNFPRYTLFRFETIRRNVFEKVDAFDVSLQAFEDWDFRIRYSAYFNVGYCDNVGSCYVLNESGISQSSDKVSLALQMQKVFIKNLNLINRKLPQNEAFDISKRFLESNYNTILNKISYKTNLFLYLKTRIKLFHLHCNR